MKKILSLFALVLMSCMGAWATDYLKASTDGDWEYQYRLHARNQSGNYWLTAGLHSTTDKANAGNFAFVSTGTAGQYYIYSVGDSKWLTYSDATDGANKIELSSDKGAYFVLAYGNATGTGAINNSYGAKNGYTIKASSATEYMNFYQGPDSNNYPTTGRIGFWQQAFDDAGSIWVLESVEDYFVNFDKTLTVSTRQIQHIRLGDDTKDLTATQNQEYRDLHETIVFEVTKGAVVQPGITINGSWTHGMVYVDWNKNNRFDWEVSEPELVATSTLTGSPDLNTSFGNLTVPADIEAGDYRMRFKTDWVGGVEAGKSPAGRIGDDGTLTTSTKNGIVSNSGCIVDVTLRVKNEISTEQIAIVQNSIDEIMTAIYADKIGYPDRHNATNTTVITELSQYQTTLLGSPVDASNYAEALAALNAIYTINDVNLPVSGKAYRMAFVGNNGTKKYIQTSGNAGDEASAAEFVCGKDGEKFIFVLKDGSKFMNYQGANTALASYTAECNSFTVQPLATSTSANLGSSTAVDRFGYVYMTSANRSSSNTSAGCMLVSQSTGAYDNSTAPYFNGTFTSAITFEEVANEVYVKLTNPNDGGTSGLDGKYVGTFSAPYHVTLPTGVKAYTAAISGSTVNFTELGTAVPANTGVLLYAESADADINENAVPVGTAAAAGANAFEAMIDGTINAGDYVLGNGTNGVGFYARVSATTAKNKAYIPGSAGSNLNAFRFDFEDTVTGIEAVESNTNATIFDLQGRRVQSAKSGLYIVNGKKVIR